MIGGLLAPRTVRLDKALNRFVVNLAKDDPAMFDIRRIEGRRWNPVIRAWTTPPSLRAWRQLDALTFTMMEYGGGLGYITWLETGASMQGQTLTGLRAYQQDGVAFIQRRDRSLLADKPGLGKTIQAVEALGDGARKVLVVAPKITLEGWAGTIATRRPEHAVVLRAPTWSHSWNCVNYEYLPNVDPGEEPFDLIADEVHLLSNVKARRTKLTLKLAERAKRVLLLTGTPPKQPVRLWPLYLMLNEREAKEFFPFALRYAGAERNDFGWDFSGATHIDELREDMRHFMLQRTMEEVLPEMPETIFTTIHAVDVKKPVEKQLHLLDAEIMDLVARGHRVAGGMGVGAMQRLRALAGVAKVPSTVEWLLTHGVPATKVLVFCEFRDVMEGLATQLPMASEQPLTVLQLHGDIKDRQAVIKQFQEDETAGVMLCQYQVSGVGADGLQCASTVVIHDLPWTPDDLEQAIARARRIGQRGSVHVVTILSGSHVEHVMLQGLQEHRQLDELLYSRSQQSQHSHSPGEVRT